MAPGEDTVAARTGKHFVGSTLAGRNVLYERFYLTSAARNRINHLRYKDRSRAYALVDGILAAGRADRR